jgi:hypothetical protein
MVSADAANHQDPTADSDCVTAVGQQGQVEGFLNVIANKLKKSKLVHGSGCIRRFAMQN